MSNYCRILIVEDEYLTRQGIKGMIHWEQEGFQIVGEASQWGGMPWPGSRN